MRLLWWMVSGSMISAAILTVLLDAKAEIWLGMAGPLAGALTSWIAIKRQHAKNPGLVTRLLIKAFAAKMIFVAVYVAVFLKIGLVQPTPFVISFLVYFIGLHSMEAAGLYMLQAAGFSAPPEITQAQSRNG